MNKQDVAERLNKINKQATGTYSGAIIKLVQMLCDIIGDLCEELEETKGCKCVDVPVQDVPTELLGHADHSEVLEPKLPKPKHKTTKQAKKGTADKAKTNSRQ